jgi:hypothetical protein
MTAEQIAERVDALKKKTNGPVWSIKVDEKISFHRKPKLQEVSYMLTVVTQDLVEANRSLLATTYLEGDREIFEDDDYLGGAMMVAQQMVEFKTAEIVKH